MREVGWWLAFGVCLGILPLLFSLLSSWLGGGSPDWIGILRGGKVALPSVTITAGALGRLVIRRGIAKTGADLGVFLGSIIVVIAGTWFYEYVSGSKGDPDRLAEASAILFIGAVLAGSICTYLAARPVGTTTSGVS